MKRIIITLSAILTIVSCQRKFDEVHDRIDAIEDRVKLLETACSEINSNIVALYAIVNALQENNYIKDVEPVIEHGREIGYTITFTKGDIVTIYHGQNGADGYTPVIGIDKNEADGLCYWTLDGEWILDSEGNMIPTTGKDGRDGIDGENGKDGADGQDGKDGVDGADGHDGKDGADGVDGEDGKDGSNGQDGADGITPQLKIHEGYWYISYDNGINWNLLDKAKGDNGDSFFCSVTSDEDNVYFTLANGSVFTVPLVKNDYISKIQSITYVPRFEDGKAYVISTTRDYSFVEVDFAVSPKSLAPSIVANFATDSKMQTVRTFTKSLDFIDLPVNSVTADVNTGVVSVKASCNDLPDAFFAGQETVSVSFQVTDGDYTATSSFIPMTIAERITHQSNVTPKVVAHRGYWQTSGSAQNSVTALRKANEIGIWGCELDLWMTSDGVLVLNHDGVINGITIQSSPYSAIKDCTIDNGETIPTFEQYLKVFKEECSDLILIIELKPHYSNEATITAIKEIIRMVNRYEVSHLVEYISFSSVACDAIVRYAPTARVAFLDESLTPQQCAEHGYTGVDYHYSIYRKNKELMNEAHSLNLDVNAWTMNDYYLFKEIKLAGADIVTTDVPETLIEWNKAI